MVEELIRDGNPNDGSKESRWDVAENMSICPYYHTKQGEYPIFTKEIKSPPRVTKRASQLIEYNDLQPAHSLKSWLESQTLRAPLHQELPRIHRTKS